MSDFLTFAGMLVLAAIVVKMMLPKSAPRHLFLVRCVIKKSDTEASEIFTIVHLPESQVADFMEEFMKEHTNSMNTRIERL